MKKKCKNARLNFQINTLLFNIDRLFGLGWMHRCRMLIFFLKNALSKMNDNFKTMIRPTVLPHEDQSRRDEVSVVFFV